MFSLFDVILLLAVFGFVMFGMWFGLIHTVGSLFGTVIAAMIASRLYTIVPGSMTQIAAFIIIFLLVHRLVGFIFAIINRLYSIISIIPFLTSINRLGGILFGFAEGILVVGMVLIVARTLDLGPGFTASLNASKVAPPLVGAASVLLPLLPEALRKVDNLVKQYLF